MSTLRISNIEAKSVPASATIDEKVKITNSSGDPLVFIDGKTSGITTVGINTTDPNITFDANSNVVVTGIITATKFSGQFEPTSVGIADSIFHTGDTDTSINFSAADTITLDTAGSQRVRVDASGIVIVSTGGARTYVDGAGNTQTPKVQIEDNANSNTAIVLRYNSGAGSANRRASFMFARTADGSAVSNNSVLGEVLFMGEGNSTLEKAASIRAEVDGTPGTTDMPGRLIFSTTDDGANTTTERLRIDHSGNVYFSGSQSGNNRGIIYNHASGFGIYASADSGTNRDIRFYSNSASTSERLRVGAGGSITHYCGSANGEGFFVFGNASQGRTTFAVRAGNTNSNASTSIRLQHANGTSVGSLFLENDSNNYNMMNAVQGAQIVFHTNESGSSLPKMRIHPDGDVQITSGNLVLSSGAGIDFSATSDASGMTSELLDDYEEGTYTPTVSFSGTTYTYGTSNDYVFRSPHSNNNSDSVAYTKIGNRVFVNFAIFWNSTITARYVITLPFTIRGSAYQLCTTPAFYRVEIGGDCLGTLGSGSAAFDTYRTTKDTSNAGHGNIPITQHSEVYYMISYETTQ